MGVLKMMRGFYKAELNKNLSKRKRNECLKALERTEQCIAEKKRPDRKEDNNI